MMLKNIYSGLLISLFTITTVYSQNWQQTLNFAEAAIAREDYKTALLTFQRLAFFSDAKENKALINFQIARCYHIEGKWQLATAYYEKCFLLAGDSLAQQAALGKIGLLLSARKFKEALAEIDAFQYTAVRLDTPRLAFYKGLAHFGNQDFQQAHLAFGKALPANDTLAQKQLSYLLLEDKRLNTPNPKLARTLSFIVPGAGQFYTGDVKNGLNSLALSAGLVALAGNIAASYSWLDASLVVLPWLQRYYFGGTAKAQKIAERKRLENQAALYYDVLELFKEPASQR